MKNLVKPVLMLLMLAALFTLAGNVLPQWGIVSHPDLLQTWLNQHPQGGWVFSGMLVVAVAVGAPRQVISFVCGFSYGGLYGTLLALMITLTGCAFNYWMAREVLPHAWTARQLNRLPYKARSLVCALQQHTFVRVLGVRLLPVGNNVLTNLVAGFTKAPFVRFWLGSALGYLPQTLIFAIAGAGTVLSDSVQLTLSIMGIVVFSLFTAKYLPHLLKHRFSSGNLP